MSTLKADILQSRSGGPTTLTKQEALRTYVKITYSGGTPSIAYSLNCSSINDDAVGAAAVTYTNSLSGSGNQLSTSTNHTTDLVAGTCSIPTTTIVTVYQRDNAFNRIDCNTSTMIVGTLA